MTKHDIGGEITIHTRIKVSHIVTVLLEVQTLFDLYYQTIQLNSDSSKDLEDDNVMETAGMEELNSTVISLMNVIQTANEAAKINIAFQASDNAKPLPGCN